MLSCSNFPSWIFGSGYAVASSSDDRMNEPPTSLGLVPHQVNNLRVNPSFKSWELIYSKHHRFCLLNRSILYAASIPQRTDFPYSLQNIDTKNK